MTVDVAYKLAVGVVGGLVVGWVLGRLFFRMPSRRLRLAGHAEGSLALAATFLSYGLVEVAGGYGFLAVFVAARAIRTAERNHEYHQVLHDFAEQIERLLTVLLLLLFGGALVTGLLAPLTWPAVGLALMVLFVIRPVVGWLSLRGAPGRRSEHWVIAAFGIRGLGTFYYLAYAMSREEIPQPELVWATAGLVVVVSVVLHGLTATPVMRRVDRNRDGSARRSSDRPGSGDRAGAGAGAAADTAG